MSTVDPGFCYRAICYQCREPLFDEVTYQPLMVAKKARVEGVCTECAWYHRVLIGPGLAVGLTRDKIPAEVSA